MRCPPADGVKVTVNVQDAPAVRELAPPTPVAQEPAPEFVIVKSPEFAPVVEGVMAVAVTPEPLLSVKVTGEDEELTFTEPKFWLVGESVTGEEIVKVPLATPESRKPVPPARALIVVVEATVRADE